MTGLMSELAEKEKELAQFHKMTRPVYAVFGLISFATALNALVGSLVFPDAIRMLIMPAFFIGFVITLPLMLKATRLQKEIKNLKGG